MTMNDAVITLVGATSYSKDADGNEIATEEERTVFGYVMSATAAEYMNAGKLGIKPTCMIEMWREEYNGEETVIVGGERMTIYRTYSKGDRLELHCSERTGTA